MTIFQTILQDLKNAGTFMKMLMVIFAAGVLVILYRYVAGIGAISNLNDSYPWGLWISFDVLCGVALAAGGFTTAGLIHIFGGEKYEPLARPAILTAFLGYLLVVGGLLVDLGRPWNIWHPMVMWQPTSVMFEVGWCVMLYTIVLAIEFSPAVFEKLGMTQARKTVQKIYVPAVIAGMLLSTLHQSSLGSLFLIVPHKLDPIWWTPILPLMFLVSAIAVGLAMVIFESIIAARVFKREVELPLLAGIAKGIPWILTIYLIMKAGDLVVRNQVMRIFETSPMAISFWFEMLIGILIPIILLIQAETFASSRILFLSALSIIIGVVLNRFNVSMIGMRVLSSQTYFPHVLEILVSACIVSAGLIAYYLTVKNLPIFREAQVIGERHE